MSIKMKLEDIYRWRLFPIGFSALWSYACRKISLFTNQSYSKTNNFCDTLSLKV